MTSVRRDYNLKQKENENLLLYFSPFYKSQEEKSKSKEPFIPKLDLEPLKEEQKKERLHIRPKSKIIK